LINIDQRGIRVSDSDFEKLEHRVSNFSGFFSGGAVSSNIYIKEFPAMCQLFYFDRVCGLGGDTGF
jgi:hypothetical protein